MNHSIALSASPHQRCLIAILQFLHHAGLDQSFETLQVESKQSWSDALLPDEDEQLVSALMFYEEKKAAFKERTQTEADTLIENILNMLKLCEDQPAWLQGNVLTPHAGNVLTVKFQPTEGGERVATGGVDKMVYISNYVTGSVELVIPLIAPILALDFNTVNPSVPQDLSVLQNHSLLSLTAGCMNGTSVLMDLSNAHPVLFTHHQHAKYVIAVKFSPSGQYLASAAHDGTLAIYSHTPSSSTSDGTAAAPLYQLHHQMEYRSPIETVAWYDDSLLYVSPREDNYLHIIHVPQKLEIQKINMNLTGDDHVSFSCMHMTFSPWINPTTAVSTTAATGTQPKQHRLLAIATDQHRLLIVSAGTGIQVRNYWGLVNDGYSTPRVVWSRGGKYVYVSQQNATVCVYDVSNGNAAGILRGHDTNVRDLDCHVYKDLLVTGSFDKTVRIWEAEHH